MIGKVYLVGAGPGSIELLTLKAHRLLLAADIVVYDRLVSQEILALAPARAKRMDVGKQSGRHPVPQDRINELLVSLGRSGGTIIRLKGGDPFLFGRGGEEALALAAAGIPFEVVPGITTAQGCASIANVPLTHRGIASGLRLIAGHSRADASLDPDWRGLADAETTLVVYMGLASISEVAERLIAHGRDPSTPVLAVMAATRAEEKRLVTTLQAVSSDAERAKLESPTIFIIGEVVRLARILNGGVTNEVGALLAAAE